MLAQCWRESSAGSGAIILNYGKKPHGREQRVNGMAETFDELLRRMTP